MSDVKRYVTTCDCMSPAAWGDYVRYDDYAALEAENAKLKGEYEWVASINTALDESNQSAWAENAKLRAELERRAVGDGWIHANDGTPNTAQEVIVFSEFDGVTAGFLDSYDEWYCPNSNYKLTRVSHWMPLPAAPGATPSAPKADPVKVQLLEALEGMVEYFPEGASDGECFSVDAARTAIAAARKG